MAMQCVDCGKWLSEDYECFEDQADGPYCFECKKENHYNTHF